MPELAEPSFLEVLDRVYAVGAPQVGHEVCFTVRPRSNKPPEERFLDFVCQPLCDSAGSVTGIHVHGADITRSKRVEAELRRLNEALEQRVAERTAALELLSDIASKANSARSVEDVLDYCLRRIVEHKGWSFGHIYFPAAADRDQLLPAYAFYARDARRFAPFRALTLRTPVRRGQGLPGRVYASGKPEWTNAIDRDLASRRVVLAEALGIATAAAFPVIAGKEVVGVMEFFSDAPIARDRRLLGSMALIGTQLGHMMERKILQDHLLLIADQEQRRIGQDLHDDVGQELTGLALKAQTFAEILAEREFPEQAIAGEIVAAVERIHRKVRALSRALVPADVESQGLKAALKVLAAQTSEATGVACRLVAREVGEIPDSRTAIQLYRIAQEAVSNAINHGRARTIGIVLECERNRAALTIEDDGIGIPMEPKRGPGVGLSIMRQRAELIGARLTAKRIPTGGTRVTCRLERSDLP